MEEIYETVYPEYVVFKKSIFNTNQYFFYNVNK